MGTGWALSVPRTGWPQDAWAPKSWDELDRKFSVQRLVQKQDRKTRILREKLLTRTIDDEEERPTATRPPQARRPDPRPALEDPKPAKKPSAITGIPSWAQGGSMNRTTKPAASSRTAPAGSKGPQKFTKRSSHVWVDYWAEVWNRRPGGGTFANEPHL